MSLVRVQSPSESADIPLRAGDPFGYRVAGAFPPIIDHLAHLSEEQRATRSGQAIEMLTISLAPMKAEYPVPVTRYRQGGASLREST